jgi:hypothetical protein
MKQTIIHTEEITQQGQYRSFQVILPNQTKKILNIGYSVKVLDPIPGAYLPSKDPFTMGTSLTIADLALTSNKKEAQFYREILVYDDAHLPFLDYSSEVFGVSPPTHGLRHSGLNIRVNGKTTQLFGLIKDIAGEYYAVDFHYRITIYLEIEIL